MIIVDRSFCNFSDMAFWRYKGKAAEYLFKLGSCGWQVQNDFNYLKEHQEPGRKCYKVITQDKQDEIVDIQASLMMGVAKEACFE